MQVVGAGLRVKTRMDCPYCLTEMKSLPELLDVSGQSVQEWPSAYWCEECGTFVDVSVGEQRVHIPRFEKPLDDEELSK